MEQKNRPGVSSMSMRIFSKKKALSSRVMCAKTRLPPWPQDILEPVVANLRVVSSCSDGYLRPVLLLQAQPRSSCGLMNLTPDTCAVVTTGTPVGHSTTESI